jgi:hypothetical protein
MAMPQNSADTNSALSSDNSMEASMPQAKKRTYDAWDECKLKEAVLAYENTLKPMQQELAKRAAERKAKANKEAAERRRQEAHKENIWIALKSYREKYGQDHLVRDFGMSVCDQIKRKYYQASVLQGVNGDLPQRTYNTYDSFMLPNEYAYMAKLIW